MAAIKELLSFNIVSVESAKSATCYVTSFLLKHWSTLDTLLVESAEILAISFKHVRKFIEEEAIEEPAI